jgi:hypothetical protein
MQGDFTLDPFNYRDGVTRVLMQQGRVQLDSDMNEQTESLLRFLRGLGRDVLGPHGGVNDSFKIERTGTPAQLTIQRGEYYVDGIRCVLPQDGDLWQVLGNAAKTGPILLNSLPNYVQTDPNENGNVLYYLDVFERHISVAEDDSLREVALFGPDTASRAVLTWRIRTLIIDQALQSLTAPGTPANPAPAVGWPFDEKDVKGKDITDRWYVQLNLLLRTGIRMRAEAIGSESTNPCIISPEARYRGTENRLFRVEIHDPGFSAPQGPAGNRAAQFKWSQDNGSIVYPIRKSAGATLQLGSLGRDARTQICVNDWVEVVDDDVIFGSEVHPLLQVIEVHPADMTVTLNKAADGQIGTDPKKHPILRRWATDLVSITEGQQIELADGVEVTFTRVNQPRAGFRPGDYWLIPTRTANGELAWPRDAQGNPRDMPPNGIDHHYAPLAFFKNVDTFSDLRRTFKHLAVPA